MVKAIRAAQLADQIRDYLAEWSQQDLVGYIFSLTQVTVSTNLERATAWVTVFNTEQEAAVISRLNHKSGEYKKKLYRHMQRQTLPNIEFRPERNSEMDAAFSQLLK
jgi:ribosome-binding factor A